MLELWMIRHGETAWNRERRLQGQSDAPLNQLGRAQARRLAPRLASVAFDRVYSSDSVRARDTAGLALPGRDLEIDPRLRELNFGVLEGKTAEEMTNGERGLLDRYRADRFRFRVPEGETGEEHLARMAAWLEDALAAGPAGGRVAAFSHGGSIRALVYALIGPPTGPYWWPRMDNTGVTRLRRMANGSVEILSMNDAAHLEGMAED